MSNCHPSTKCARACSIYNSPCEECGEIIPTPDNAPAHGQRVSDAQVGALKNSCIFVMEVSPNLTAKQLTLEVCDDLLDARQTIAAQAERIATLERERDEARTNAAGWHRTAEVIATILGLGEPDANFAAIVGEHAAELDARVADLTSQLAEAERAGLSSASDAEIAIELNLRLLKVLGPPWEGVSFPTSTGPGFAMPAAAAKDEV